VCTASRKEKACKKNTFTLEFLVEKNTGHFGFILKGYSPDRPD